ncbi:MAG: DUF402 domain-containing protein [Jatrophihabitans sp.]
MTVPDIAPVRMAFTKWDGSPHWRLDTLRIGEDEYGVWLWAPRGTVNSRPGAEFAATDHTVSLVPRTGNHVIAFCGPDTWVPVYVDMTTQPGWDGDVVTMVDLDLDVVRHWDGSIEVLDEDEFAEHQVRYGYPPEIVELARQSCAEVAAALRGGAEPFGSVGEAWLAKARELQR